MMEEANWLLDKRHAKFLCSTENSRVVDATSRSSNELHTASAESEDIVRKGEEGIRTDSNFSQVLQPSLSFFSSKGCWYFFKVLLKVISLNPVLGDKSTAEQINGIAITG
jgi:hypothetical protein